MQVLQSDERDPRGPPAAEDFGWEEGEEMEMLAGKLSSPVPAKP